MFSRFGWLLVVLVLLAGCGNKEGPFAPVSGVVLLNGKPLADASVSFTPVVTEQTAYGPGSHAITDAQGRFTLKVSSANRTGALVGKHTVRISLGDAPKGDPGGAHLTKELLPPRYNSKSELTFEVLPDGTQEAKFELTKP
jgi:hypothetical protein